MTRPWGDSAPWWGPSPRGALAQRLGARLAALGARRSIASPGCARPLRDARWAARAANRKGEAGRAGQWEGGADRGGDWRGGAAPEPAACGSGGSHEVSGGIPGRSRGGGIAGGEGGQGRAGIPVGPGWCRSHGRTGVLMDPRRCQAHGRPGSRWIPRVAEPTGGPVDPWRLIPGRRADPCRGSDGEPRPAGGSPGPCPPPSPDPAAPSPTRSPLPSQTCRVRTWHGWAGAPRSTSG